jgi:hypothetical protein
VPSPHPAQTAAEAITRFVRSVAFVVLAYVMSSARLPQALATPLQCRLNRIEHRFKALAALVAAGKTPRRRRAGPRRSPPAKGVTPPPGPYPRKRGWFRALTWDYKGPPLFGGHLDDILRQPAMVEMIAVAPDSLVRDLRWICWMLGLKPPPHLARPRPAKPKPAPAKAPKAPRARRRPWRPSVPPPLGTTPTPAESLRAHRRRIPA